MQKLLTIYILGLLGFHAYLNAGEVWMTDFAAAKIKAAADQKPLLLDFTGSDWCGWCIKLD